MPHDLAHDARSEEPCVSRVPHAVWINRPAPVDLDGSRAVRSAVGALAAVGIFTLAIASPASTAPAPQALVGTDAEMLFAVTPTETLMPAPAAPRSAGYLPAQLFPAALHSPEEQPPTF
ncbi:MAG TPA: hypothetical protein VLC47_09865 [Burkholderiales bacterium]|nr:hypothetical protein [Burkholderiales bacterium]